MDALGRHLLLELKGCDRELLDDLNFIRGAILGAAEEAGATIVGESFHKFHPMGVTGLVAIAVSHICIHTWPEYGYAAVDFYTCGQGVPEEAHAVLLEGLEATGAEVMTVDRGLGLPGRGCRIRSHVASSPRGGTVSVRAPETMPPPASVEVSP